MHRSADGQSLKAKISDDALKKMMLLKAALVFEHLAPEQHLFGKCLFIGQ